MRQRIDLVCTLNSLDRAETERYIQSHLQYAGGKIEIFTGRAQNAIHGNASGIPRINNRICRKSLIYAFQHGKRLIDR